MKGFSVSWRGYEATVGAGEPVRLVGSYEEWRELIDAVREWMREYPEHNVLAYQLPSRQRRVFEAARHAAREMGAILAGEPAEEKEA